MVVVAAAAAAAVAIEDSDCSGSCKGCSRPAMKREIRVANLVLSIKIYRRG